MNRVDIHINLDEITSDRATYDQDVSDSLKEISALVPKHTSKIFKRRLWTDFKLNIWKQQGRKCAYCERVMISFADSHLEHYRPKSEVRDGDYKIITREAYWWLVYDHRNYLVSCLLCNSYKGKQFPIEDNLTRVEASDISEITDLSDEGVLGNEVPLIINPRYKNPKPHFVYRLSQLSLIHLVFIESSDSYGTNTIDILDLNRAKANEKEERDFLVRNRGNVLKKFKADIKTYEIEKAKLDGFKIASAGSANPELNNRIDSMEHDIVKMREVLTEIYLTHTAEYSGMCLFWLKKVMDLEIEILGTST